MSFGWYGFKVDDFDDFLVVGIEEVFKFKWGDVGEDFVIGHIVVKVVKYKNVMGWFNQHLYVKNPSIKYESYYVSMWV